MLLRSPRSSRPFGAVLVVCAARALAACSSSTPAAGPAADAGNEYRGLGQSCDPSSPHPCETLTDACSVSECQARVCVRVFVDAGPTCSNAAPPTYDAGAADGSPDGSADGGDASADASGGSDASDASADAADATPGDAAGD